MSLYNNHQLTVCFIHISRLCARFSKNTTYLRTYSTQRSHSSEANRSHLVKKFPVFYKPRRFTVAWTSAPHLSPSWVTQIHLATWPRSREAAVVKILCTPDDGCGWHPKHVEWTCIVIVYCFVLHLVGQLLTFRRLVIVYCFVLHLVGQLLTFRRLTSTIVDVPHR